MIRWLAPVRARPSCLVILAALSLLVPSGASAGANVSPAVWDALGARGEARVLINLADEPGAPREREERLRRARTSVLSALSSQDLRVRRTYARVPAIAGTIERVVWYM